MTLPFPSRFHFARRVGQNQYETLCGKILKGAYCYTELYHWQATPPHLKCLTCEAKIGTAL